MSFQAGDYDTTETVNIPVNSFTSDDPSASVTISDLAASDIEIHKDGSTTQRASDNGVTVSIDFDSITGNHMVHIDLSDNSDADYYANGSRFTVRMEGTTIDGATVNAWIGAFSIGCLLRPTTAGRKLDVTATGEAGLDLDNTSGTIDAAQLGGDCITAAKIADDALVAANFATGCLTADAFAADALVAATFATGAFTADAFAADALVAATFATGAFTADGFAADALVAATFATDSITTDALASSALQDIAQIIRGTKGVVYFVATDGNDGNDGLSPDTAKLSAHTVINAASANDVVIVGPGTFAATTTQVLVPTGVTVKGAGKDVTIITSTVTQGNGCMYVPGTNSLTDDLTIKGATTSQCGLGSLIAGPEPQFTDAVLRRVRVIADADALRCDRGATTLSAFDCNFESDGGVGIDWGAASASTLDLVDCRLRVDGSGAIGIMVNGGTVRTHNLSITLTGSSLRDVYVVTGSISMHGGKVLSDPGDTTYSLQNAGGDLVVCGVDYDRSKTTGTIIEISSAESALVANKLDDLGADWLNNGRLDNLLDAIPTTAMRGTDNASTHNAAAVKTAIEAGGSSIAGILADSNELQTDDIPGTLATIAAYVDSEVAAIKAVTDNLPDSGALSTISTDTARLTAARAAVLTDWIDGGRLDVLLDAVSTHNAAAVVAALGDIYYADVYLTVDEANTKDEYTVQWYKNGAPVTSGITVPKIQVVARATGNDLVALTAMTEIGSTGAYKYDEATKRLTAGESAVAYVTATIDGSGRTWRRVVGRDSVA